MDLRRHGLQHRQVVVTGPEGRAIHDDDPRAGNVFQFLQHGAWLRQVLQDAAQQHDIGFDRDERNNGLTHKIDPDTDKERDYIVETLKQTGAVVKTDFVTPKDTITKAKTAHGEEFFTDGRIVIVWLRPAAAGAPTSSN